MLKEQDLPERWSAKRKSEIVVRLLRGEDLGELSREIQVLPGSWFSSLPPGPRLLAGGITEKLQGRMVSLKLIHERMPGPPSPASRVSGD